MSAPVSLPPVPRRTLGWFSRSGRCGCLVLAGCLSLVGAPAPGAERVVSKEYQLKAAYLYNFTKFVEWPEQRFRDPASPIVIGVLGRNPFGDELNNIVRDRTVNGHTILVILITTPDDLRAVHLLFVPAGEEPRPEFAAALAQRPGVLTAGESGTFLAGGGVITFTQADDKLRFTINLESAERAGLKLSAQLLKLATVVHQRP